MIKKQVITRSEVRTIYSSEKQERMKVYFELTEQYNQCMEPCKVQPVQLRPECQKQCEKIYDKYIEILKPRYENEKEKLDMQVKNSPIFTARKRKDRSGWFWDIADCSFRELIGLAPNVDP